MWSSDKSNLRRAQASCQTILESSRTALTENGRLLVVEQLLPDAIAVNGSPRPSAAMDLNMLGNLKDARERTRAGYDQLVTTSGYANHQIIELTRRGSAFRTARHTPQSPAGGPIRG